MKHKLIISFGMGLVLATSCSNSNKENTSQNDTDTIVEVVPETKLIVEEVEKTDSAKPETPVIATKQVNDGTLNVTKVSVVGSILNVELILDNSEKNAININFPPSTIYYIDDATAKKNSLLKDDAGQFMITPTKADGQKLWYLGSDKIVLISLKFAVPAPDSKTISLTLGDYGSFDALPITR